MNFLLLLDLNVCDTSRKGGDHLQPKEENSVKKIKTASSKETETFDQNKQTQLVLGENEQPQVETGRDNKVNKKETNKCEELEDLSVGDALTSENTAALMTSVRPAERNIVSQPKMLHTNSCYENLNDVDQCKNGNETENRIVPKNVGSEVTSTVIGIPSETFQELDDGDVEEASAGAVNIDVVKEYDADKSITAVKNISNKESPVAKRVRFELEGPKTSSSVDAESQPSKSKTEIGQDEPQIMFSDGENEESYSNNIDQDVSQRIARIHNLLRSDRLRTNRKRKYPVV